MKRGRPTIADQLRKLGIETSPSQAAQLSKSAKSLHTQGRTITVEPDGRTLRVTGVFRSTGNPVAFTIDRRGKREVGV